MSRDSARTDDASEDPLAGPLELDDTESLPTAEAFSILADETRLEILRALGATGPGGGPQSFSELRERVGLRDSGQFNYHLDKLLGEFVRRDRDEDDEGEDGGYELTYAGVLVYQALVRGTFDRRVRVEPFDTGIDCHECGGTYEAEFSPTSLFTLECPDCGARLYYAHFPPRGLENRSRAEFLDTVDQWIRQDVQLLAQNLCPNCSGDVVTSVVVDDAREAGDEEGADGANDEDDREHRLPTDDRPMDAYVRHECQRCQSRIFSTVGMYLLTHPSVVSFYDDHGVDLREEALWDLDFASSAASTERRGTDPLRVAITVSEADDELELVLDETGTVVDRTRR